MKKIVLILLVLIIFTSNSEAQVNFRIGIDTFGNYKTSSDEEILIVAENGEILREAIESREDSNLGISLALEILPKFKFLKVGLGMEYGLPRELRNIEGFFSFLSFYFPARIELPLPSAPYLLGNVGVSLSRGDKNYKSPFYRGVTAFNFGKENSFEGDLYYAGGIGIPINKKYSLEAIFSINREHRKYQGKPSGELPNDRIIAVPNKFSTLVIYSKVTISLGYNF